MRFCEFALTTDNLTPKDLIWQWKSHFLGWMLDAADGRSEHFENKNYTWPVQVKSALEKCTCRSISNTVTME
jgi:hypothetical protein